jgi:hypothetical protein
MTLAEIDALIAALAAGPSSASTDAGSVTQRSLSELLALREQIVAVEATTSTRRGMTFTRLVPPGMVQE